MSNPPDNDDDASVIPFNRAERQRQKAQRAVAQTRPASSWPSPSSRYTAHELANRYHIDICDCPNCQFDKRFRRGRFRYSRPDGGAS